MNFEVYIVVVVVVADRELVDIELAVFVGLVELNCSLDLGSLTDGLQYFQLLY